MSGCGAGPGGRTRTRSGSAPKASRCSASTACAAVGLDAGLGLACYPSDGTTEEELSALAWERATAAPERADSSMDRVRELIAHVAPSTLSVLVRGEAGTGKELCVELLHRLSPRAARPLVRINRAAFPEALLESELFGHVKGAFTAAHVAKVGLIEAADGGTVFLDEIGELSPGMQSKLLRVLESHELRRVGGLEIRPIDVRFVAATHRALGDDIEAGRFRRDLYFRLSGRTIVLPPLRQRRESIEGLARAFAARAGRAGRALIDFTAAALMTLHQRPWPGNVRELRHAVERAVLFAGPGPIDVHHLGFEHDDDDRSAPGVAPGAALAPAEPLHTLARGAPGALAARARERACEPARRRRAPRERTHPAGARRLRRQPDARGARAGHLARHAADAHGRLRHRAPAQALTRGTCSGPPTRSRPRQRPAGSLTV